MSRIEFILHKIRAQGWYVMHMNSYAQLDSITTFNNELNRLGYEIHECKLDNHYIIEKI